MGNVVPDLFSSGLGGVLYGRSREGPEIAEGSLAGPFLPGCILGKDSFRWVLESEARDPPQSHVKGYAIFARRGFCPLAAERPGSSGKQELARGSSEANPGARCVAPRSTATAPCP